MKFLHFAFVALLLSITIVSCSKENEEDLNENCETTNVTYSVEVRNILDTHCMNCHSQQLANGGIRLHDYNNVKVYADNGRLLGSINHEQGYVAMPLGQSKIPLCDIQQIEAWIVAGAQDN
jgi:uncharacterized membrane protein